ERTGYRAVLADWRYLFFLAPVLFISVVYCQYLAALPLAIKHANLNLWGYGAVVALNAVIVAACGGPATKDGPSRPLLPTRPTGFGLVAIGYCMYAIALVPFFIILGTLIWTASEIIGAPTTFAYPGMVAPAHLRGRYVGAMLSIFGLGNAVGPIIGVALWDHLGQQFWLWWPAVAVLATVCARSGMRLPGPEPAAEPEPTPETVPAERAAAPAPDLASS